MTTDAERANGEFRAAVVLLANCKGPEDRSSRSCVEAIVACHYRAIEAVKRGRDVAMEGFIQDAYKQGRQECDAAFKAGNKDAYETGRRDENEAAAKAAWEDGETIIPDDIPQAHWSTYSSAREDAAKDILARMEAKDGTE